MCVCERERERERECVQVRADKCRVCYRRLPCLDIIETRTRVRQRLLNFVFAPKYRFKSNFKNFPPFFIHFEIRLPSVFSLSHLFFTLFATPFSVFFSKYQNFLDASERALTSLSRQGRPAADSREKKADKDRFDENLQTCNSKILTEELVCIEL